MIEDGVFTAPSGRRIGFARYGDPKGAAVFYCHGLPSSRLEAKLVEDTARRLHLHLIALDRPGYGRSDPLPPATIADWPSDLEQVADHLQIKHFSILGVSGGGPYALAGGARLKTRVINLSLVCPLGPVACPSLRRGMSTAAHLAFFLTQRAPWALPWFFGEPTARFLRRHPDRVFALLRRALPEKDHEALANSEIYHALCATVRQGLSQGAKGVLRDFHQYLKPWGFALNEVEQPTTLWHGSADTVVPLSHSQYLAERLPNATLFVLPAEGHYSLPVNGAPTILASIVQTRQSS